MPDEESAVEVRLGFLRQWVNKAENEVPLSIWTCLLCILDPTRNDLRSRKMSSILSTNSWRLYSRSSFLYLDAVCAL